MSFISIKFFCFFIIFFCFYYTIHIEHRYIVLAVASYIFYGWNDLCFPLLLLVTTFITYLGGLTIYQKEKESKKKFYFLFLFLNLLVLIVFKYYNFFISNINFFIPKNKQIPEIPFLLPVGLSFYVFQSSTYLHDIYKGKMAPELNFLRYSAFVSFFPTLLSGPIQKSRKLLPQIRKPLPFDFDNARKGFILIIWGIFEKIVVSSSLMKVITYISNNILIDHYQTAFNLLGAISFSLYIYADFSSYSDIARGIAKILGINIEKNFNNPYLSTSLTEFWNRWHCSLNEWFVDIVYIPMGGSRNGKLRKYINIFTVFFISGLWHGASWNFILWGVINGLIVIVEQIITPVKSYIYKKLQIDEKTESIVLLKRLFVFWIITITWIFFRVSDVGTAINIIKRITIFEPVRLFVPDILSFNKTVAATIILFIFAFVFCAIQYIRKNETHVYQIYIKQPMIFQISFLALLLMICIFVHTNNGSVNNMDFLYFNF